MGLKDMAFRASHPVYSRLVALRLRRGGMSFVYGGRRRPLFFHPYNETWENERAVEIPLAMEFLDREPALEVGNVLGHYGRRDHVVIDKYEKGRGVLNLDILDHSPADRYARIVAISTLEHVGFDEDVRDPGKRRRAIEHLAGLLAPEGKLLVSMPVGYNAGADASWEPEAKLFDEVGFLRRVGRFDWREVAWEEARQIAYGHPFPAGNAVGIGVRHRRD